MMKQHRSHKPQWQVIAENLVGQALRDVRAKRRRIAAEKAAAHRLFNLEARIHVRGVQ